MHVVYTGSLPRPAVPQLRGLEIVKGVPFEVPDEIGMTLLDQSTFEPVNEPETDAAELETRTMDDLRAQADEWGMSVPSGTRKAELVTMLDAEAERRAATADE